MGDVYRATDVRLQRDVALKLMASAGTDDTQRIERFLQEARVTAALDHANIVKVFDVGVSMDGRTWSPSFSTARRCVRGSGAARWRRRRPRASPATWPPAWWSRMRPAWSTAI